MKMFDEWGFWGGLLASLVVGNLIYFGIVAVWAWVVERFYCRRFHGADGRRRFMQRFIEPPMPTFQKPVRTLPQIWRRYAGWGFAPLGFIMILNGLQMIERGEPNWIHLAVAILFPVFHGISWSHYRMAKRAFAELKIESL